MMNYKEFLGSKGLKHRSKGIAVSPKAQLHDSFFKFQDFIVRRALAAGKYGIFADCGLGKALRVDHNILTSDGWVEIGNAKVGMQVFGSDGFPHTITGVFPQGVRDLAEIVFSDGQSVFCDWDHLWKVYSQVQLYRNRDGQVLSASQIKTEGIEFNGGQKKHSIPLVKPIEFGIVSYFEIDPHTLGVILGDGNISQNACIITNPDIEFIRSLKLPDNCYFSALRNTGDSCPKIAINGGPYPNSENPILIELKRLALLGTRSHEKFIPRDYLYGSVNARIAILQGLLDTDGYTSGSCIEYTTTSKQLSDDVCFIVRSLGGTATQSQENSSYIKHGARIKCKDKYRSIIKLPQDIAPFRIASKKAKHNPTQRKNPLKSIISIEKSEPGEAICISVDSPDSLYVIDDFVLTHNTIMQLVWADYVAAHTEKPVIILCPLAVSGQTIQEGVKFSIPVERYCSNSDAAIQILNYDRIDEITEPDIFGGIVADESSILKNFSGILRNKIIDTFKHTPFKLACTATPSPNDPMELGNHAEFLDVMSRNEMLAMFFVHDGGNTSKWRLKGHAKKDFYRWISQWAVMLSKPSDLGFSDDGYILPPLNLIEHKIETEVKNGRLFNDTVVSATNFNAELRKTKEQRMRLAADIVNGSSESFIVWIKQNEEGDLIRRLIPDAVEVRGSDKREWKEDRLLAFARGEYRVLITKQKIAQFGLNFQNCHNQIVASLDFSFEALYQSIRRSYRFLQEYPVNIHLTTTDTMQNVIAAIERKQKEFETMQREMSAAVSSNTTKNDKSAIQSKAKTIIRKKQYQLFKGDCVELSSSLPNESVDLSIFSPPFSDLYVYSDSIQDMGNCKSWEEFYDHFSYLIPQLYRVTKPGRLICVHCMDLPIHKGKEGYIGVRDFSGMLIKAFQDIGFIYHSRITIWKDPVTEMQRTKALGLLHKQLKKDSTMSRVGMPDYVLLLRKPGENAVPVRQDSIPVEKWQEWASPVWLDVNQTRTLQYRSARAEQDEKHLCPLQLDTIQRLVALYSNENEIVFSPFAGIGSEGYMALKMQRRFVGIELKDSYFRQMVGNMAAVMKDRSQLKFSV